MIRSPAHGPPRSHPASGRRWYAMAAAAALAAFVLLALRIRPPGLFALYVTGYSAFRIFEETLRIDSSEHFLGLRLNFYVAGALTVAGIAWFVRSQRSGKRAGQGAAPQRGLHRAHRYRRRLHPGPEPGRRPTNPYTP
jgi:prolipoprotein diacylglyceryltransferase